VVPLHERLRAYARARATQASEGKVDTGQSQKERLGLQPVHRHRQDLHENDPASRSKTPDDAEGINAKQAPPRAPDWRNLDLRVRVDAASKALPYELPKPEFATPAGDVVPLHERLRAYARARLIQASDGKVVALPRPQTNGHGNGTGETG
jgi:hypothetical protein